MGADLILAHLDVTELWDDPDRARDELNRRIDAVTKVPDWYDDETSTPGDLTPTDLADAWRNKLREHVEVILDGSARDLATIEVAGRTILLTGGMSWGDSPTEALDAFTDLDEAGILVEPWPWEPTSTQNLVVVAGNIADGFRFFGPYGYVEDAVVVGERLGEGYDVITVTPLHPGS